MNADNSYCSSINDFIVLHNLSDKKFINSFKEKIKGFGIKEVPDSRVKLNINKDTLVLFKEFDLGKLDLIDFAEIDSSGPILYLAVTKLKLDVDLIHFDSENVINEYKLKPYTDNYTLLGLGVIHTNGNSISVDPDETIYSLASKFGKIRVLKVD